MTLEIQSYPGGNGHFYGNMRISGSIFTNGNRTISGSVDRDYPELGDFYGDICRILPRSDFVNHPTHWESYEVGESTIRFYNLNELIYSAVWVALDRIEGEFHFEIEYGSLFGKTDFYVNKYGTIKFSEESKIKNLLKKDGVF